MATAYVTLCGAGIRTTNGVADVARAPFRSETVTTSAVSSSGALVARAGEVALIHCTTALYADVGAAPTAAPTTSIYIPAGETVAIGLQPGDKVALINV